MKSEALSQFPHLDWTLYGGVIFTFLFVGVLIWVFRKGSIHHYHQLAKFPFEEDQP